MTFEDASTSEGVNERGDSACRFFQLYVVRARGEGSTEVGGGVCTLNTVDVMGAVIIHYLLFPIIQRVMKEKPCESILASETAGHPVDTDSHAGTRILEPHHLARCEAGRSFWNRVRQL